jgi:hypothetical protein
MIRSVWSLIFDVTVAAVLGLAAALLIVGLASAHEAPTISLRGDNFVVRYAPGVVHACTVFRMTEPSYEPGTDPNFPDGHYSPRSCSLISKQSTSYVDHFSEFIYDPKTGKPYDVDWDVYAELWYDGDEKPHETNRVRVHK